MKKSSEERKYENGKGRFRGLSKAVGLTALLGSAAFGCKDFSLAPRWNADLYLPVIEDSFSVMDFLPIDYIPAGASAKVSFQPISYDPSSLVRDGLKNLVTDSTGSHLVFYLTLRKKIGISMEDTIFVSPDSESTNYANSRWILFPIRMEATDTLNADSVVASQENIGMLKEAAINGNPLWVQTSGNIKNPGSGPVLITPGDSIAADLSIGARIRVSERQ